jgi:hypothetical protein
VQAASVQMRMVKAACNCLPRHIGSALLRSLQDSRVRAAQKIIRERHLIGNDDSETGERDIRRVRAKFERMKGRLPRLFPRARRGKELSPHSATICPDPPSSLGKSFSFGNPSRIGSTVSA